MVLEAHRGHERYEVGSAEIGEVSRHGGESSVLRSGDGRAQICRKNSTAKAVFSIDSPILVTAKSGTIKTWADIAKRIQLTSGRSIAGQMSTAAAFARQDYRL